MKSLRIVPKVTRPQGKAKSSEGVGGCKKRMPAAERHREYITCWIGQYPTRKGADMRRVGHERLGIRGLNPVGIMTNHLECNKQEGVLSSLKPYGFHVWLEPCARKPARTVRRGEKHGNMPTYSTHQLCADFSTR